MDRCEVCEQELTWKHDHQPDRSGLDDGPFLVGMAPRKRPPAKSKEEVRAIRAMAWATRRAKYGSAGHR